ncbi:hypothetical protein DFJ58DRAFT_872035 [Suillus subalutaceus]|uniref:uncharacterized protein n=1 Tax=Suillus subalutaceus TaxID=48586 RepID=UPI001B8693E4|nr:uncharacterized protein DFJ58DRAFT_872035 [Suillus subalutaceus]KAG1831459.1 hypothetical protein DFJ58DRAFT_872035 [Suillus subalutaceus]
MADSSGDERSVSRGRDAFQSSGRGGVGNIRRSSISSDSRSVDGPDDSDLTRGREPLAHADRTQMFSVGRGGAGNIRSPSQELVEYEQRVKTHHAESNPLGGLGNISSSRSRSRSRDPMICSTGRGGVGNIQYGAATSVDNMDEEERKKHAHAQVRHSIGRGGAANLANVHSPDIERYSPLRLRGH